MDGVAPWIVGRVVYGEVAEGDVADGEGEAVLRYSGAFESFATDLRRWVQSCGDSGGDWVVLHADHDRAIRCVVDECAAAAAGFKDSPAAKSCVLHRVPDHGGQCWVGVVGVEDGGFSEPVLLFGQQFTHAVSFGGEFVVAGIEHRWQRPPP